ncbi:DUF4082 domain-containing protein, partial [Cyanobium sp. Copco_Reservoir_LC18]|uniref:DUF4082 domain-containing protein n=1 Tax=Cyanobium sp. Copco_Reservoir_LC18 TaxID=1328305 RepID=UPI001914FCEF
MSAIVQENLKTGTPKAIWDAPTSNQIEGFATDFSVDNGSTVNFKINVNAAPGVTVPYRIEIYRLGYYGGDGATLVTTINTSGEAQPNPVSDSRGLVDAGNWSVSASWATPSDAVSGVYLAKLQCLDGNGNPIEGATNQIPFIIRQDEPRADGSKSDILLQTSDTTWQAYNGWGGNNGQVAGNLYDDPSGSINRPFLPDANPNGQNRAYAVSYNRPFITRNGPSSGGAFAGPHDYLFGADYAAIFWLEKNGYDVSYISGVDTDRLGASYLQGRKAFISVGHDEYWSGQQRSNVEAARDAGVNLLFWGGNDVYWKTRWETSIVDGVAYRTLVCYKETRANYSPDAGPGDYANIDPSNEWTGTWRDLRFVGNPGATGQNPENALTGQLFGPDDLGPGGGGGALDVPAPFAALRFWRDTAVAQSGGQLGIAPGIIGYEWNTSPEDDFRPAGLIKLSETTLPWNNILIDQGNRTAPGIATHNLSLYRDVESGALVFGAGTVFWTWALSNLHDNTPYAANIENRDIQQFTVNMFADMGIQPGVADAILFSQGLVRAVGITDTVAAKTTINDIPSSVPAGFTVLITGTAIDDNGTPITTDDGKVGVVEISFDGGASWKVAQGTTNWTYAWRPSSVGIYTINARAIDDSLNIINLPLAQDTVTVSAPIPPSTTSLFNPSLPVNGSLFNEGTPLELGMKFRPNQAGTITELKYFRAAADAGDTDVRIGRLWRRSDGSLLASATFTSTPGQSGWQVAALSNPVTVLPDAEYVVSYITDNNYFSTNGFFNPANEVAFDGIDDNAFTDPFGILSAPQSSVVSGAGIGGNGVFRVGTDLVLPNNTFGAANYWVDVTLAPGDALPPVNRGAAVFSIFGPPAVGGTLTATQSADDPNGNGS